MPDLGGFAAANDLVGRSDVEVREAIGDRQVPELITAFCEKIAELSPRLVTFNGHSFDLLALRYRAMVLGVSAPGLSARPYFHRYTEDAIDRCDVFASQATASLRVYQN